MNVDDLKPHPDDKSPMTPERAFTICELIAYRYRDMRPGSARAVAAEDIAHLIHEVAREWR